MTDELKSLLDKLGEIIDRKLETMSLGYLYIDQEVNNFYSSKVHKLLIPIAKDLQIRHDIVYKKKWCSGVSLVFSDRSKLVTLMYRGRDFDVGHFSPDGKFLR